MTMQGAFPYAPPKMPPCRKCGDDGVRQSGYYTYCARCAPNDRCVRCFIRTDKMGRPCPACRPILARTAGVPA